MLYVGKMPELSWHSISRTRKQNIHVMFPDGIKKPLPSVDLTRDLEEAWCPGWEPDEQETTSQCFYASRRAASTLATKYGWPKADDRSAWSPLNLEGLIRLVRRSKCLAGGRPALAAEEGDQIAKFVDAAGNFAQVAFVAYAKRLNMSNEGLDIAVKEILEDA